MKRDDHRGNGHASDTFVMSCPKCRKPLMLSTRELEVGHELECIHCQHNLHLSTTTLPGQSGQFWTLVSAEENRNQH
jgi:hypothetical protein